MAFGDGDYGFWGTWTGWLVLVVVALGIGLFYVQPRFYNRPEPSVLGTNVTEKIIKDPQDYYGSEVTVSGEIGTRYDSYSFLLDEYEDVGHYLLVITKSPAPQASDIIDFKVADKETYEVTGVVRQFNILEAENEFGLNLRDEDLREWEGRPAIMASRITRLN
jgi:hypothetical protein